MTRVREKIHILQVNKFYYPEIGGIEKTVQQIAEGLNKDEFKMKVLTCKRTPCSKIDWINGIEIIRAGSFGVWNSLPLSIPFFWRFKNLSKSMDIIQFHMPFPLGDLGELLFGYHGKIVVWWHSDIVRQKKWLRFYQPVLLRFLNRADVILAATESIIDSSEVLNRFREKCRVIPFGIRKAFWEDAEQAVQIRRMEIPAQQLSPVVFLFVGRLVYYKGCEILLQAFEKVEHAKLILIGDGPMRQKLLNIRSEYRMEKKVQLLLQVSEQELKTAYQNCDVFVFPSTERSEAFGLVQLEAMAYEKPIINTNLPGGVPYVSLHGITGLTVEPGQIKELTDAMNWMVNYPKERIAMGKRARIRVKTEFSEEMMLDRLSQLYKELVERKENTDKKKQ